MASMLLGEYLRDAGYGDLQTRSGMKHLSDFGKTHAWLEQDGLLVDITADQFAEVNEAVIVTSDSAWHQEWHGLIGTCVASLAYYDRDDYRDLIQGMYGQLSSAADRLVVSVPPT